MFPSGGSLAPLKWGQNEDAKGEAEDFKSVTIEFYGSNIVYYDSFGASGADFYNPFRNEVWPGCEAKFCPTETLWLFSLQGKGNKFLNQSLQFPRKM